MEVDILPVSYRTVVHTDNSLKHKVCRRARRRAAGRSRSSGAPGLPPRDGGIKGMPATLSRTFALKLIWRVEARQRTLHLWKPLEACMPVCFCSCEHRVWSERLSVLHVDRNHNHICEFLEVRFKALQFLTRRFSLMHFVLACVAKRQVHTTPWFFLHFRASHFNPKTPRHKANSSSDSKVLPGKLRS